MNNDLLRIKTSDTEIGVGKAPMSDKTLIVIEDRREKSWITLSKQDVHELIGYLKETIEEGDNL